VIGSAASAAVNFSNQMPDMSQSHDLPGNLQTERQASSIPIGTDCSACSRSLALQEQPCVELIIFGVAQREPAACRVTSQGTRWCGNTRQNGCSSMP